MHSVCVYCKTVQLKVHCCLHTHTVIHLNYMMLVQMSNNAPNTERTNERTLLSASCKAFNDIWYIDHCYCLINHVQLWFRWKKNWFTHISYKWQWLPYIVTIVFFSLSVKCATEKCAQKCDRQLYTSGMNLNNFVFSSLIVSNSCYLLNQMFYLVNIKEHLHRF